MLGCHKHVRCSCCSYHYYFKPSSLLQHHSSFKLLLTYAYLASLNGSKQNPILADFIVSLSFLKHYVPGFPLQLYWNCCLQGDITIKSAILSSANIHLHVCNIWPCVPPCLKPNSGAQAQLLVLFSKISSCFLLRPSMSVSSSYPINIGASELHTHCPLFYTFPLNNAIDSYSNTISSLAPTPPPPSIPYASQIAWFPDGTSKPPLPKSVPSNLTLLLIPRFQLLAPPSPRTSA